MSNEVLRQQISQARGRYFATLGRVEELTVAAGDGPPWPGQREAWRVIRRPASIAIVSDGLSDPFDSPKPNAGLGIEVLAETSDPIDGPIEQSWLLMMARSLATQFVEHGGFRNLIDKLGLICLELPDGSGVLLGVQADGIATEFASPQGPVRVITATLLQPVEMAYAGNFGQPGLIELQRRFVRNGWFHRSSPARQPVFN
jgi:hypothetical protein